MPVSLCALSCGFWMLRLIHLPLRMGRKPKIDGCANGKDDVRGQPSLPSGKVVYYIAVDLVVEWGVVGGNFAAVVVIGSCGLSAFTDSGQPLFTHSRYRPQ